MTAKHRASTDPRPIIHEGGPGLWLFWCPGCDCAHGVNATWEYNGSRRWPSFRPSILTVGADPVCHSYVTYGRIEYLADSTHHLAGQTVDLPPWPYD